MAQGNQNMQSDAGSGLSGVLAERVRRLRALRGMTRSQLAADSGVSERYLAQVEGGEANATLSVLEKLAGAFDVHVTELLPRPHYLTEGLVRTLEGLDVTDLRMAPKLLGAPSSAERLGVALVGLRGAGKSTIGERLADVLGLPFVRLVEMAEQAAGMEASELISLRGQAAYRRFERESLEQVIAAGERVVLEAGGSIVSERETYARLLDSFYTVWLRADPEDHLARVAAQGDHRPMAGHADALGDLRRILDERTPEYARTDSRLMTSGRTEAEVLAEVLEVVPGDRAALVAEGAAD